VVAEWWVCFGTAVPFWSSGLVVARHPPHGRSPGGDHHLNFYGDRDNLLVTPDPGRLIQHFRPLCGHVCSRRVTLTLDPRGIRGGLVIVRVAVAALGDQRPTGQLWRGPLASRSGRLPPRGRGNRPPSPTGYSTNHLPGGRRPVVPKAPARAKRASASSSPPIAVIECDGRVTTSPPSDPSAGRQRPSYQDPPGSCVLLGGPGHPGYP
jgi:hypothetical protein